MEIPNTIPPEWPGMVAIIGGGTMGLGVAECLAAAGLSVRLVDATPELSRQACDRLMERVRGHVEAGLLQPGVLERAAAVRAAEGISAAVKNVDLVFEAVPEQLELKRDTLAAIAAAVPQEAVIATNTSSLPIDELATSVHHPGRFLGMHWFNPPEWTPGIEIIRGPATDPDVVTRVMAFLRTIGKHPIMVGSGPGFVGNRLQFALFQEALACVEDGLASPEEIDEVVRSCFGFRLPFFGPFQIADMAGLDVYANVFETLERGLGDRFRVPPALRALVEQGRLGAKSGAGFSSYTPEAREHLLLTRDRYYAALAALLAELRPAADE
ncbi:MAG TPA: 3-hydroxyacyl-CoA dehydrogenase family protein [Herpetosiphonaceae bacterium]|nr:3-hydroxyacyl-CoA dehydrogenase family protein [Herpetosiphonaceae bacterium]